MRRAVAGRPTSGARSWAARRPARRMCLPVTRWAIRRGPCACRSRDGRSGAARVPAGHEMGGDSGFRRPPTSIRDPRSHARAPGPAGCHAGRRDRPRKRAGHRSRDSQSHQGAARSGSLQDGRRTAPGRPARRPACGARCVGTAARPVRSVRTRTDGLRPVRTRTRTAHSTTGARSGPRPPRSHTACRWREWSAGHPRRPGTTRGTRGAPARRTPARRPRW